MANTSAVPISSTLGQSVNLAKLDPTNDEVAVAASATQNGCTPYYYNATGSGFDATVVKASAGRLYAIYGFQTDNIKFAFLKIYDKATAPDPSADSALLKWTVFFPPTEALETDTEPQWKWVDLSFPVGLNFANGIGFVITQNVGTDETAVDVGEVFVNLAYK
jgi:hypothetical protein